MTNLQKQILRTAAVLHAGAFANGHEPSVEASVGEAIKLVRAVQSEVPKETIVL